MERKSSTRDVHQIIKKDLTEMYKTLSSKLGNNNPFAKFNIGAGYYIWSDNRCEWRQITSVDSFTQSLVREALFKAKRVVAATFGDDAAEKLFMMPDESYIYFNDDEAEVRVLLTGWGFKKPVDPGHRPDTGEIKTPNPVNISFLFDGERLPNYEFGLQSTQSKRVNRVRTGENGKFFFEKLGVGESLMVRDFATNQEFNLVVEEGRSTYEYDVTVYSPLRLQAEIDGQPLRNEEIRVAYHGKMISAMTDGNGAANARLPFHQDAKIEATMRDQTKSELVRPEGNKIVFSFETPVETDVQVFVSEDFDPVPNAGVKIIYCGETYTGVTDGSGQFNLHLRVIKDETCCIEVAGYDSQSRELSGDDINVFRFDKTTPILEPEDDPIEEPDEDPVEEAEIDPDPIFFEPHIKVEGDKGFIGRLYPITVEYDGVATKYKSDMDGIVMLPQMLDGNIMKVTDVLHPENIQQYELDSEQSEYIFHVPYEPQEEDCDYKVTIRDLNEKPIKCDYVLFAQNGNERLAMLSDQGSTFFGKDAFKFGQPIDVSIVGGERDYGPIKMKIDEDEKEYLLQEKKTKPLWLMVAAQVATVAAAAVALGALWSPFCGFCHNMFNAIYH